MVFVFPSFFHVFFKKMLLVDTFACSMLCEALGACALEVDLLNVVSLLTLSICKEMLFSILFNMYVLRP
jgi:hypothetical protein